MAMDSIALFHQPPSGKPLVYISACLLGERVRYDGDQKQLPRDSLAVLQKQLQLRGICPEVGAGLSVPRPPVQLTRTGQALRAIGRNDPNLDVTEPLQRYADESLMQAQQAQPCGYVLKARSPSCGLGSTPVFDSSGELIDHGNGFQADAYQAQLPWLLFIEETALASVENCQRYSELCQLMDGIQRGMGQRHELLSHYRQQGLYIDCKDDDSNTAVLLACKQALLKHYRLLQVS